MSLYGNVKRVASSTFQFDRVYPNRVAMEAAQNTDGVYAGRYILIEYGQRYEKKKQLDTNGEPISNGANGFVYETDEEGKPVIVQTEEYSSNYNIDVAQFGVPYDSTVWQKIYSSESGEKYVMVAELNALAPKLNLEHIDPVVYSYDTSANDEVYILGTNPNNNKTDLVKLNNVKESINESSFDLVESNELQYELKFPDPVKLELGNKDINYNKEGFDVVYSIPIDDNDQNSYIGWVPKGLNANDVDQTGDKKTVDTKSLHMNLPAFGNTIKELYDLIYGRAEESPYVRPYFKKYWSDAQAELENEELGYSKDPETDKWVSNDDESWLNNVPGIGELLANNTEGLAGILGNLLADRDPLSGTVRYYLNSDWTAYYDYNSNAPFIDNKPDTVGYLRQMLGEPQKTYSNCDYIIDYSTWELQPNIVVSLDTDNS